MNIDYSSPEFQEAVKKVVQDNPEIIKNILLNIIADEILKESAEYSY